MTDNTVEIEIKAIVDKAVTDIRKFVDSTNAGFNQAGTAASKTAEHTKSLSSGIDQVGIAANKTGGMLGGLTSVIKTAIPALVAYATVSNAIEFIKLGAKAKQAEASFRAVSGAAEENADDIIAAMTRASGGTVDASYLMQKATKGMTLDRTGADMIKIAEMSRTTARVMGTDVGAAMDMITDAVSTNMPRALKQAGLITRDEMKVIGDALAAGVKDVDLLSIAYANFEKQQAKMGPMIENEAEQIQKLTARWEDLKETLEVGLLSAFFRAKDAMEEVASIPAPSIKWVGLKNFFGGASITPEDNIGPSESRFARAQAPTEPSEARFTANYLQTSSNEYLTRLKEETMRMKVDFDALVREGIVAQGEVPTLIEKFAGKDEEWQKYLNKRKLNIKEFQEVLKGIETVAAGKDLLARIEDASISAKSKNAEIIRAMDEELYPQTHTTEKAYFQEYMELNELKDRAMQATGERQIKLLDEYIAKAQKAYKEGDYNYQMSLAYQVEEAARVQQDAYDGIAQSQQNKADADEAMLKRMIENLDDVTVEIQTVQDLAGQPMKITLDVDEAMANITAIQNQIAALMSRGLNINTHVRSGASEYSPAENSAPYYEEPWTAPSEPTPIEFEPEIVMSPPVPFREGVQNMKNMLMGLGDEMSGAIDLGDMSSMVQNKMNLAKQSQQMMAYTDPFSTQITPGFRQRSTAEARKYDEIFDLQLKILQNAANGTSGGSASAGGLTVNIDLTGMTVNGAGGSADEMAGKIESVIANKIKYGRSEILRELQSAKVVQ